MTRKDELRAELKSEREAIAPSDRLAWSTKIGEHLLAALVDREVERIASYSAFRGEVDLSRFHERWLERGARLALPRVVDETAMEVVEVDLRKIEEMRPGRYGILEPAEAGRPFEEIEVVLVPGLGFDRDGGRIGFGAGYYDRFLARLVQVAEAEGRVRPLFVGVGFSSQVVDAIPMETHDVALDALVTEHGFEGLRSDVSLF